MGYFDMMRMLDLNIAGEFLVMAATLMLIKSRMLLPVEQRADVEEEDEDDPRWELVKQLVEYKKFKDAALHLEKLEHYHENIFAREGDGVELGADPEQSLRDVSLFDLLASFHDALGRVKEDELTEIFAERFTVPEKIDVIVNLLTTQDRVSLMDLFRGMSSRQEMVCTFLAVLELMRLRRVAARQDGRFGDIVMVKVDA